MQKDRRLQVTDMHTAGEPVRIVTGGYPELSGATLLEKRREARDQHDLVRRVVMLEPRGHSEMYGVIPVQPDHPDAALAVLFTHNEGYSTMCGHATIAMGRWIVDQGLVQAREGDNELILQCPCGPVQVCAQVRNGQVTRVRFLSVPSFTAELDHVVRLPGLGEVPVDIGYGGAFYAVLPAARLGLDLYASSIDQLRAAAIALTETLGGQGVAVHPEQADLSFLYGTILTEEGAVVAGESHRHLCFFADGQLDRSPTGSGVSARLALAAARGEIAPGEHCEFVGVSGIPFGAGIVDTARVSEHAAVITKVSGSAYYCGRSEFIIEANDPLAEGMPLPKRGGDNWPPRAQARR